MQFGKLLAGFETWLREDQDRGDLTVSAYLTDVQNFAIWLKQTYGREYSVERVTPTDIKDYRTWLQAVQKQKASSINRRLAALRTFFKWAALSDRVGRSPLNGIKPLRQQEAPPRWLDPQAEHKLQQALELHAPSVSAERPQRGALSRRGETPGAGSVSQKTPAGRQPPRSGYPVTNEEIGLPHE